MPYTDSQIDEETTWINCENFFTAVNLSEHVLGYLHVYELNELQDVHAEYEKTLMEIASSLQLSRSSFIALLSLQSWKSFMRRWIKSAALSAGAGVSSSAADRTYKAANDILKVPKYILL